MIWCVDRFFTDDRCVEQLHQNSQDNCCKSPTFSPISNKSLNVSYYLISPNAFVKGLGMVFYNLPVAKIVINLYVSFSTDLKLLVRIKKVKRIEKPTVFSNYDM